MDQQKSQSLEFAGTHLDKLASARTNSELREMHKDLQQALERQEKKGRKDSTEEEGLFERVEKIKPAWGKKAPLASSKGNSSQRRASPAGASPMHRWLTEASSEQAWNSIGEVKKHGDKIGSQEFETKNNGSVNRGGRRGSGAQNSN